MGEVYRAKDTRLDRIVAIKILSPALASDITFRQRFEREARTISAIEHPHICSLYDVGEQRGTAYIVMQFLEGQTLADRLAGGGRRSTQSSKSARDASNQPAVSFVTGKPLALNEALEIATQIAGALERAHRSGVVHRDLKPANIMLTKTGAKLLDFGLAKVTGGAVNVGSGVGDTELLQSGGSVEATGLARPPANITTSGTILGTFQYMAPEQVEGREADARADIFAFGVVLYEMLTGRKAFEAPTHASLVAAILEREPRPLRELLPIESAEYSPAVLQALERAIRACLAKDPDARLQSVHDLALQLRWISEGMAEPAAPAARKGRSVRELVAWGLFGVAALAAAALGFKSMGAAPADARVVRFSFASTPGAPFSAFGASPSPTLSPDGRRLAYETSNEAGDSALAIRALDAVDAQIMAGTEDAVFPFWSADNRFVAFFAQRKLKKISADGGPPQNVCDVVAVAGGAWNEDGTILFGGGPRRGILRVSASGGSATPATTLDGAANETFHSWPAFLPDGKHFLYIAGPPSTIYIGTLDSPDRVKLAESDSKALYADPGFLLFMRQGILLAQPFDAKTLKLGGEAVPVTSNVGFDLANSGAAAAFSVSGNVLAYRTGTAVAPTTQFEWFDRTGKAISKVGPAESFFGMDLSPDDSRIAAHRHDPEGGDIWLIDAKSGTSSRFTFDATRHYFSPVWSRDGSRLAYATSVAPGFFLYQKPSNGAGNDEKVAETTDAGPIPSAYGATSETIIFSKGDPKTRWDIWAAPLDGKGQPRAVIQTKFSELLGQLSPDGRFIAFQSDESGREEVYVQPFPSLGGKWQISKNGGSHARWRKDGKELFYLAPNRTIMAVDIQIELAGGIRQGTPTPLFVANVGSDYGVGYPYAVTADGQRILVEAVVKDNEVSPMTVTVNWPAALKK